METNKMARRKKAKRKYTPSPTVAVARQMEAEELEEDRKTEKEREKAKEKETDALNKLTAKTSTGRSILDDFESTLSSNEPVRELFTGKNIRFKTELTDEQRGAISVLYSVYMQCIRIGIEFDSLKDVLDQYIEFGVSVGRKGREEYSDSLKALNTQQTPQQQGQLNNMKL